MRSLHATKICRASPAGGSRAILSASTGDDKPHQQNSVLTLAVDDDLNVRELPFCTLIPRISFTFVICNPFCICNDLKALTNNHYESLVSKDFEHQLKGSTARQIRA